MKYNIDWQRAKSIATPVIVGMAFLVSVGFSDSRQGRMKCNKVVISILDTLGQSFVEPEDIRMVVHNKFGELEGQKLSSINISLLEKIIANNPFIADAEVFSSVDGKLNIEVLQRRPVVRVVNFNQESFYIDDQGFFMPLSEKYTARVPVANGYIFHREAERKVNGLSIAGDEKADTALSVIARVYKVAHYVSQDDFWSAQIEQIYINASGEMELIPRVGLHTIVIGDGSNLEDKFARLFLFYNEGLNKAGWDKYKTINLKFKDQVVCTKK